MTDPAAAADATWAAADTLHVAARALRNPHLRCAADSYDRAARAAHGRLPRRSRDGDQLRRTARMIALAGNLAEDTTLMAIALMAQLVALAAAVAELRQAQQHAAQAAAARAAATHLHSAVTQARSQVPRFGHARSKRPTRAASAAQDARRDFPARLRPTRRTAGPAEAPRPHSRPQRDASRLEKPDQAGDSSYCSSFVSSTPMSVQTGREQPYGSGCTRARWSHDTATFAAAAWIAIRPRRMVA